MRDPLLWHADDPDVRAVRMDFDAGILRIAPALVEPAKQLMQRLARPNWTMEWYLPRWLGEAMGVPPAAWRSLMLSNVYGLGYVRLQDDLSDGDVSELTGDALPPLSTALYALWMDEYLAQFGDEPAFWDRFRCYLSQWIEATLGNDGPASVTLTPLSAESRARLAHRGAPLKICCAGLGILAGRREAIDELEKAIDHLLAAAVLLDHAADWVSDLDAGRYNAFVGFASPLPQDAAHREVNRQRVREELYLGAAARPYYETVRDEIRAADQIALAIGCEGLQTFLAWLDAETVTASQQLAAAVREQLHAAAAELFGVNNL